jgi:hypothetical protein
MKGNVDREKGKSAAFFLLLGVVVCIITLPLLYYSIVIATNIYKANVQGAV